jgi:hypothetical protein
MKPTSTTKKVIINPPGTQLNTKVVVTSIGSLKIGTTYKTPLPTLNQAISSDDKSSIVVTAIVLVNTKLTALTFKINQLFTISDYGKYQLQFFIYCDEDQLTSISENLYTDNTYNSFKVEFTTSDTTGFPIGPTEVTDPERYVTGKSKIKDIEVVQTFLWDIDPKTSRGTVTTVQSGTL